MVAHNSNSIKKSWKTRPVLVLESDLNLRFIFTSLLREAGATNIIKFDSNAEALEALALRPYGLIIADWPTKENHFQNRIFFVKSVRHSPTNPNQKTPIMLVSPPRSRQEIELARDVGATEFMLTPITSEMFFSRLNSLEVKPREFISSNAFKGPDRRRSRDNTRDLHQRVTDDPLSTVELARASIKSLAKDIKESNDPLTERVTVSLQNLLRVVEDYTDKEIEIIDLHSSTISQLKTIDLENSPLRENIVSGLEQTVSLRVTYLNSKKA
jgi:two-component system chemotaxis response regulator CheY